MANDAKLGIGTVHKVNTVAIVGVEDSTPLKESKPKIDSTNYGSGGRQSIQGLAEADDITLTVQYNPSEATHQTLDGLYDSGADAAFQFVYPFGSSRTVDFTGKVVSRDLTNPVDNKMMRNYVIAPAVGTIAWS